MRKQLDGRHALFTDLELACWRGRPPSGQTNEIIEIGIARLSRDGLEVDRAERFLIRPKAAEISEFCTELTGITSDDLRREGRPLNEVLNILQKKWGVSSRTTYAWGDDGKLLKRACNHLGLDNPFADIQNLGQTYRILTGAKERVGLETALKEQGLSFEGRPHSGVDDAINTARIFAALAHHLRRTTT